MYLCKSYYKLIDTKIDSIEPSRKNLNNSQPSNQFNKLNIKTVFTWSVVKCIGTVNSIVHKIQTKKGSQKNQFICMSN